MRYDCCGLCATQVHSSLCKGQHGETCYVSTSTVLGVVDCSTVRSHLAAYTYYEGEDEEGGNNVACKSNAELEAQRTCGGCWNA